MKDYNDTDSEVDKVAIIGMSGRFPGAVSVGQFWQNILNGIESIHELTDAELQAAGVAEPLLTNPLYVKKYGKIDRIDLFDAAFFRINPREAELIDPQHRLFLECAWEALEDAGYDSFAYKGFIGVYGGSAMNDYLVRNLAVNADLMETVDGHQILIGNAGDYLTTRVSYKLNLRGPSMAITTGCSTSLVAVHAACLSLLNYQCDMALAGGVSLRIPQAGYLFKEGHILSPSGQCRAFDADANGTVPGEGAGIVVLKRLKDAVKDRDGIYAVISGAAINNDGAGKVGFTAPSVNGQASVIAMAHALAGVKPHDISFVETHGTGTPMGDPIEIEGLKKAFEAHGKEEKYCALGAVKTNIGHLDSAAGIVGLIKTALALKHCIIPPTPHFSKPNPRLDLDRSPFFVPTEPLPWKSVFPRRAGVSSFGIGGTNAHAVLEEAPVISTKPSSKKWHVLAVSTQSENSLLHASKNLLSVIETTSSDIADIAFTLQCGRKAFAYRKAVVCRTLSEAANLLKSERSDRTLAKVFPNKSDVQLIFMFSGQGTQYAGMSKGLYETEPIFRNAIDRCLKIVEPLLGTDLRSVLYPCENELDRASSLLTKTSFTQPVLFIVEYGIASLLMDRGIRPSAMIGHSLGEFVAACFAGVLSLEDALALIVDRAKIMQEQPAGVMLSICASEEDVRSYCTPQLEIAVVNTSSLCVVGGSENDIAGLENRLTADSIQCRRLHTSHAFHTSLMQGAVEPFEHRCSQTPLHAPTIPFISNQSGTWITPEEACAPSYWSSHLRNVVRFSSGIETLLAAYPHALFIEIGPGNTLCTLCQQHFTPERSVVVAQTLPHAMQRREDEEVFLSALSRFWESGVAVDWTKTYGEEHRKRVSLPTYPFERQRFWIEPPTGGKTAGLMQPSLYAKESDVSEGAIPVSAQSDTGKAHLRSGMSNTYSPPTTVVETFLVELLQRNLGIASVGILDDFFELGGHSLLGVQIFNEIYKKFNVRLPIATLIEHPTVQALAVYLRGIIDIPDEAVGFAKEIKTDEPVKNRGPEWSTVVAIQTNGDLPPFFCVAGIGGNPMNFRHLSECLGKRQPFYALQYRGVDGILKPHETIEAMAEEFVTDIRRLQLTGPYYIGGYSLGGIAAYEMAQQLQKMGESIGGLVLLDTSNPKVLKWSLKGRVCAHLSNLWSTGFSYLLDRVIHNVKFRLRRKRALTIKKDDFAYRLDVLAIQCNNALLHYEPAPLNTNVVLIKSALKIPPSRIYGIGSPTHESNGWRSLLPPDRFDIRIVHANHLDMLSEPLVAGAAKEIAEGLAALRAKSQLTTPT